MTSRLGTGKPLTFFYSVYSNDGNHTISKIRYAPLSKSVTLHSLVVLVLSRAGPSPPPLLLPALFDKFSLIFPTRHYCSVQGSKKIPTVCNYLIQYMSQIFHNKRKMMGVRVGLVLNHLVLINADVIEC